MNTLGTRRISASGTLHALVGSKSPGVGASMFHGILSRSMRPGSRGATGAAGAGVVVGVDGARVVLGLVPGLGAGETSIGGSSTCASAVPTPVSVTPMTDPHCAIERAP